MDGFNKKPDRDLLFWSGGKDAFLALCYYRNDHKADPLLITTYDDESGLVPHQKISIERIRQQAAGLGLIHFAVPISRPADNKSYLNALARAIEEMPYKINQLIFGDLHLEDIRKWREEQFHALGYKTAFPIWNKPVDELIDRLEIEPVTVQVSAVLQSCREHISPGDLFNRDCAYSLPEHIDRMGENGEFHTEVIFDV
jgi:diphthamide synthase (EF-2-diphthine--ammonia ligase)